MFSFSASTEEHSLVKWSYGHVKIFLFVILMNTQCHPEKLCCPWLYGGTCVLRCFSSGPSPLWWPARGFRIQTLVSVLKQRKRNLPDRPVGSDLDCSTGGGRAVLEWKENVVWVQRPSDTASPLTCSLSFAVSHPLCLRLFTRSGHGCQ